MPAGVLPGREDLLHVRGVALGVQLFVFVVKRARILARVAPASHVHRRHVEGPLGHAVFYKGLTRPLRGDCMRMSRRVMFFTIVLSVALSRPSAFAQDLDRMDQVVRSYAEDAKTFMGAVLVARDGKVLLSRGYGQANLEWNIPNTPATRFRIGSVTKQFTAAAILLLEERGRLSVDDPVKKHLPDAPAAWDAVTVRHLLTHSSGIPSFTSFPDYRSVKMFSTTPEKIVASFRDKPLEFQPGEKWNYSNSGYVLLGHLIEKISGGTYETFMRENIFTPLGMTDSGYDLNRTVLPRRAAGYSPSPAGPVNAEFIHMSVPHGAGALYSTTEDLLRWSQGLFGGKLLSTASFEKMTTAFKSDYGFGVAVRMLNGRRVIDHGGGIEGFQYDSCPTTRHEADDRGAVQPERCGGGGDRGQAGGRGAWRQVRLSSERKRSRWRPTCWRAMWVCTSLTPKVTMTIALARRAT